MPVKVTIVHNGSNWPIKTASRWIKNWDETLLSKRVLESNTETGYTVAKYFVDQTAREKYKSVNEKELARSTIQRSANSITVVVSSEKVDSIP